MARKDNRIVVKSVTITLPWPLFAYLERAMPSGFYGATYTSAAEAAIEKHIEFLIAKGDIVKMTAAELAVTPEEFLTKPRKPKPPKRPNTDTGSTS